MTGHPTATVVWIDAEQAIICRWVHDAATIERLDSEVPARHRSTGHVRHEPGIPHAGGRSQDPGESHRLEHLRGFLADVARAIPDHDTIWLMGPGQTHERLAEMVATDDREHGRRREVRSSAAGPSSDRQLAARARELAGDPPRRRRVGIA
jgi:hypothetical protein